MDALSPKSIPWLFCLFVCMSFGGAQGRVSSLGFSAQERVQEGANLGDFGLMTGRVKVWDERKTSHENADGWVEFHWRMKFEAGSPGQDPVRVEVRDGRFEWNLPARGESIWVTPQRLVLDGRECNCVERGDGGNLDALEWHVESGSDHLELEAAWAPTMRFDVRDASTQDWLSNVQIALEDPQGLPVLESTEGAMFWEREMDRPIEIKDRFVTYCAWVRSPGYAWYLAFVSEDNPWGLEPETIEVNLVPEAKISIQLFGDAGALPSGRPAKYSETRSLRLARASENGRPNGNLAYPNFAIRGQHAPSFRRDFRSANTYHFEGLEPGAYWVQVLKTIDRKDSVLTEFVVQLDPGENPIVPVRLDG